TEEHHRAVSYAGGWSDYVAAKALGRSQQRDAYERFAAEKGRLTERAHTQRQWSERAVKTAKRSAPDNDKIRRKAGTERSEKQEGELAGTMSRHECVGLRRRLGGVWERRRAPFEPAAMLGRALQPFCALRHAHCVKNLTRFPLRIFTRASFSRE
ncbi:MAG: hypothetical protein KY442_06245, partial [Proteobacteria bacterium]|nr:hypothetical protein [Pseudomonadota bacterium]